MPQTMVFLVVSGRILVQYLNHTVLQTTPFFTLYGHHPNHFGITATTAISIRDLASWLQQRNLMNELLKQHLL
jgi:hypothetical protein